jgi:rod shape-determining protein MreC
VVVISFQPNNPHKRLFAKGKYQFTKYGFALVLSLMMMSADYHYHALGQTRSFFNLMVSPLQYLVDYPVRMFGWVHSLVRSKKLLVDENMQLRSQQTLLEAKLQKLLVIRHENSQLKELLSASVNGNERAMAAEILAVDMTNTRQLLVLDKGKQQDVYVGQPVLDAKGVMGQVIDVGLKTSTVMMISDAKSAVPVRNNRTGETAILNGSNSISELALINLPKSSSIMKGDLLVTSGLGRRYPEGYPVGQIETIQEIPGDEFIKVLVAPIAQLNRSRLVLLIWPAKEQAELTQQIDERMKVVESRENKA